MKQYKGMGLLEILLVIVVISVMTFMLLPRVIGSSKGAYDLSRKANISSYAMAMNMGYVDTGEYPKISLCSNDLWNIYSGSLVSKIEDPVKNYEGIDECTAQYKYIPFNDTQGGVLIAEVEQQSNAHFIYTGTVSSFEVSEAISAICEGETCGDAPWYTVVIVK